MNLLRCRLHPEIILCALACLVAVPGKARAQVRVEADAFAKDSDQQDNPGRVTELDGDTSRQAQVSSASARSGAFGVVQGTQKFEGASVSVSYSQNDPAQQAFADAAISGTDLLIVGPAGGSVDVRIYAPATISTVPPTGPPPTDPFAWNNLLWSDAPPTGAPNLLDVSISVSISTIVNGDNGPGFGGTAIFSNRGISGTGLFDSSIFAVDPAGPRAFASVTDPTIGDGIPGFPIGSFTVDMSTGVAQVTVDTRLEMTVGPPPGTALPAIEWTSLPREAGGSFGLFAASLPPDSPYRFEVVEAVIPEATSLSCWAGLFAVSAIVCGVRRTKRVKPLSD